MRRMKEPTPALANLWKKNFINDTSKFAKSTHLEPEDYMTEFTDKKGEKWIILGSIEGKEIPCQNVETREVYVWDRWDVSSLKHPEIHEKNTSKQEFFFPEKKKGRAKKVEKIETPTASDNTQLSLFEEE
jgi:hypothetical protein